MITYTHCEEVRDEFSALLDGELSSEELEAVETHLSQCADCLRVLDGMKQVDNLFTGMENVRAPENFEERVLRTVRPKLFRFSLGLIAKRRIVGRLAAAAVLVIVGAGVATVYFGEDEGRFETAALNTASPNAVMRQESAAPSAERALAADAISPQAARANDEAVLQDREAGQKPKVAKSYEVKFGAGISETAADTPSDAPQKGLADAQAFAPSSPGPEMAEALLFSGERAAGKQAINGPVQEDLDGAIEDGRNAPNAEEVASRLQPSTQRGAARGRSGRPAAGTAKEARRDTSVTNRLGENAPVSSVESDPKVELAKALSLEKKESPSWDLEERDGAWFQIGYAKEKTTTLTRDSQALKELIAKHPTVAELLKKKTKVVFRVDDVWYTLSAPTKTNTLPPK